MKHREFSNDLCGCDRTGRDGLCDHNRTGRDYVNGRDRGLGGHRQLRDGLHDKIGRELRDDLYSRKGRDGHRGCDREFRNRH